MSYAYSRLRNTETSLDSSSNPLTVNSKQTDRASKLIPRLPNENDEEYAKRKIARKRESHLHTIGWIIFACITIYYTQLITVIQEDVRIRLIPLYITAFSSSIICMILIYISFILPRQIKVSNMLDVDFQDVAPTSIYSLIACGTINYFCSIIGLWPVYEFSSILIVTIIGIALIMTPNIFPSFSKQKD
jgi:hypothetical protein